MGRRLFPGQVSAEFYTEASFTPRPPWQTKGSRSQLSARPVRGYSWFMLALQGAGLGPDGEMNRATGATTLRSEGS